MVIKIDVEYFLFGEIKGCMVYVRFNYDKVNILLGGFIFWLFMFVF